MYFPSTDPIAWEIKALCQGGGVGVGKKHHSFLGFLC